MVFSGFASSEPLWSESEPEELLDEPSDPRPGSQIPQARPINSLQNLGKQYYRGSLPGIAKRIMSDTKHFLRWRHSIALFLSLVRHTLTQASGR